MASKQLESIVMNPNWGVAQRTMFYRIRDALPVIMSYADSEVPILDNHSDAQLVDETGVLKQVKKYAETAEKAHVERLKARMGGEDTMRGEGYKAEYVGGGRVILNQGACKDLLEAADDAEVHLLRLLAAIKSGQIVVPDNVKLADESEKDGLIVPPESNHPDFYTSAAGGRSLYVKPIA